MVILILKPISLLLFSFAILISSNIHADAFKCIDNQGNTIFQDSECGDDKKETKIQIKKYVGQNQCTSKCDSARNRCVTDLGLGERNTGKALHLCEQAKQACIAGCNNADRGRELEAYTDNERSAHERELRYQQALKNEEEYQKLREKRAAEREQNRKRKNCNKYEKRLAKIEARWARKQQSGWKPKDEEYYLRRIENAKDDVKIECQQ